MNLIPVEFSMVITAANHNPSIITADFLKNNKIVPEDFKVKADNTVCTPMVSQIIYQQEGISIIVDQDRAMFMEKIRPESENAFRCPNIVERFIDTLKFVNYTAIGINQKLYATPEGKDPQQIIFNTLIKTGGWNTFQNSKPQIQVNFVYPHDEKKLTLIVSAVEIQLPPTPKQKSFGFQANFHYDISNKKEEKIDSAKKIITNYKKDIDSLHEFLTNNFLKEFSK